MNISGRVNVEDKEIDSRDAAGISKTDSFNITSKIDSELLFIEVPMIEL